MIGSLFPEPHELDGAASAAGERVGTTRGRGPAREGGASSRPRLPDAGRALDDRPRPSLHRGHGRGTRRDGRDRRRPGTQPLRLLQDDGSGVSADRGAPPRAPRRVRDVRGRSGRAAPSSPTSSPSATPTAASAAWSASPSTSRSARTRSPSSQRSVALLEATIDATADGILVVDANGKMVHFNRRFVDMWRIPPDIVESRDENRALGFVPRSAQGPRRLREEGHDGLRAARDRQPRRPRALRRSPDRARLAAAGSRGQDGRPRLELPRRDRRAGRPSRAPRRRCRCSRPRSRPPPTASSWSIGTAGSSASTRSSSRCGGFPRTSSPRRDDDAGDRIRARPAPRSGAVRQEGQGPLRRSRRPRATTGSSSRTGGCSSGTPRRRRSRGVTVGRVWSFHDVTRLRLMEDTIRRHARAFDHISDAVITMDLEARIVDWNPGAERMFGYNQEEMLGKTPDVLRPANAKKTAVELLAEMRRTGRWSGEMRFVRKDGVDRHRRHGRRAALRRLRADARRPRGLPRRDRPQAPRGVSPAGIEPLSGRCSPPPQKFCRASTGA